MLFCRKKVVKSIKSGTYNPAPIFLHKPCEVIPSPYLYYGELMKKYWHPSTVEIIARLIGKLES